MKATHIWLSLYLSFVDLDSWVVLYHPLSLPGLCTLGSAGVLFSRFLKLLLISVWSYICCLGRFLLILFQIWCWYKDGWVVLFVYFSNSQTFHSVPAWMWLQMALMMKTMTKDWLGWRKKCRLTCLKGKMMLKCFRIARTVRMAIDWNLEPHLILSVGFLIHRWWWSRSMLIMMTVNWSLSW